MQRKKLIVTLLLAVLVFGAFGWTGARKAYADSVPSDAYQDMYHRTFIDEYGCAENAHEFYLFSEGSGYCDEDKIDQYDCYYCNTSYCIKRPATKHNYVKLDTYSQKASCEYDGYNQYECSICGKWYSKSIPALGHNYKTHYVKASRTNQTSGYKYKECTRCGSWKDTEYWGYPQGIELSYTQTYSSGKAKKPKVTVRNSYGDKISSSHYKVTYSDNKKPGKATVKITFDSKRYKGSMKTSFRILPGKIKSVSASYKSTAKLKVKWKKMSGVSGYAVYYSTSSKFPDDGCTCIKMVSKDKSSVVIPYMAGKTYYVRVAGYKTFSGEKYRGKYSDKKKVKIKSGASMTSMLSHLKSTTKYRKEIKELTNNQVDIKKYSSTMSRIKALYTWHAKNSGKFIHCLACNENFNRCLRYLIKGKEYDNWLRIGCDRYRNNSGSIVQHKWSVVFLQGVPYNFDPRMQGNLGNPTGFSYFGFTYGSSVGKHYLFDGYYDTWYY